MKHVIKLGLVIIIYAVLLVVVDFILGIGIKDQWDKLNKWSRN
ncbi:MAG: hypothetical protein K0R78_3742 [Pelosinus sp.]|jgi:hypothetical protein|nr:hypothetical protein [Pelosinus sp.]